MNSNVICVMHITWAIHADTFFSALTDINTRQLANTCATHTNKDVRDQFTILKKCRGKLDCLIYEMLFIKEKKPKLNAQSDSIKANYLHHLRFLSYFFSF